MVLVGGPEGLREKMREECLYMAIIAVGTWASVFAYKKAFSILSETVTYKIRAILYDKIL